MRTASPRVGLVVWLVAGCAPDIECPAPASPVGSEAEGVVWCEYEGADGLPVQHGPWIKWAEERVVERRSFIHGRPDGRRTFWAADGTKVTDIDYEDGEVVAQFDYVRDLAIRPLLDRDLCSGGLVPVVPVEVTMGGLVGRGCASASPEYGTFLPQGDWILKRPDGTVGAMGSMRNGSLVRGWRVFDENGLLTWGAGSTVNAETEVEGRMIVGFFPPVLPEEIASDAGTREGVAHLEFALQDAKECLEGRGVIVTARFASALAFRYGDRVEEVVLPLEWPRQVGAYLLDPERPPSVVYARAGPSSLAFLLPNAAAEYFDAPACQREP